MLEALIGHHYKRILISPVSKRLQAITRLKPNHITLCAAIFGITAAIAASMNHISLSIMLLLLSGYCDSLDGGLAREQNQTSSQGAILDIMADRLVECAMIIALFLIAPATRGLACLIMFASIFLCVTSFLVVAIFEANDSHKSFYYSLGLIERAEAFGFFIAMLIWPSVFQVLALVFSALVLLTTIARLLKYQR